MKVVDVQGGEGEVFGILALKDTFTLELMYSSEKVSKEKLITITTAMLNAVKQVPAEEESEK